MRKIIILIIISFCFSCYDKEEKDQIKDNQIRANYQSNETLKSIASSFGRLYINTVEVELNTKNRYTTCYVVVVEDNSVPDSSKTICYNFLNHSFIPGDFSSFLKTKLSHDVIFDRYLPKYLKQDNQIVFSLIGTDINQLCVDAEFDAGYGYNDKNSMIFSDDLPIKFFSAPILIQDSEGSKKRKKGYFQIGFISYDARKEIDFDAYFNSKYFKYFVRGAIHPVNEKFKENLKISNFATK